MGDGSAVLDGRVLSGTRCGSGIPRCQLLANGGQSGPNPIWAYENQVRRAGESAWTNLGFWCPQSRAPTPAPNARDIRDRAIRLLPVVPIATTAAHSLVNISTLLWASTPAHRDLGRVTITGRPVWLRLDFQSATWDFGDHTRASTRHPGKPYDAATDPCAAVRCPDYFGHTYRRAGAMHLTLRVAWHATYSLDGTHYQPVDGDPITGPPATRTIAVRQARPVLVPNAGD